MRDRRPERSLPSNSHRVANDTVSLLVGDFNEIAFQCYSRDYGTRVAFELSRAGHHIFLIITDNIDNGIGADCCATF